MDIFQKDDRDLSVIILRFAVGSIFLWFGLHKITHPVAWLARLPDWLGGLLPSPMTWAIVLAGLVEMTVGLFLVSGRYVREAAAAGFLFLLAFFLPIGADDLTVRDAGLMGICLALFVYANARAKHPVPRRYIATASAAYIFFLFVTGLMFLRSPY